MRINLKSTIDQCRKMKCFFAPHDWHFKKNGVNIGGQKYFGIWECSNCGEKSNGGPLYPILLAVKYKGRSSLIEVYCKDGRDYCHEIFPNEEPKSHSCLFKETGYEIIEMK